jgi:hypothetical protein
MKNIHVLPTDKPSRLFKILQFNFVFDNQNKYSEEYKKLHKYKNQHIYITSDEEIKDGDWYYLPRTNLVHKCIENPIQLNLERGLGVAKIILTTDIDLINDGVQSIDNTFLEWFVKNPSCESVEVEKYHGIKTSIAEISAVSGNDDYNWKGLGDFRDYKIIIPKEEPKQETLEEAAERLLPGVNRSFGRDLFIQGAKWQAERMYSEEEVLLFLKKFDKEFYSGIVERNKGVKKWFSQFKNKNNENF